MKKVIVITVLTLPIAIFAQGQNKNVQLNSQMQAHSVNYFIQVNNDDATQQKNPSSSQQAGWSIFGTENNKNKPCSDCEEVNTAIKAAKTKPASSGKSNYKKSSGKKWGKRFAYNFNLKAKKMFSRKYKAKTTYSACFNG